MNKVVNINLNGFIFTIDEQAYELLKNYLESLNKHFKDNEGAPEIVSDIETRIAELLQQGLSNATQVVQILDVQRVIKLMGEPWQIEGEETKSEQQQYTETSNAASHTTYKLRRDPANKVIGGVCGGIANYLNIDPIIFRMIFAVSFFIFGSGFLLYLILWIAIPKAKPGELNATSLKNRRMFRDPDDKKIGGICGGLGNYFGIDPVWFRIGFLVSFFVYGSGFLLYLVLWIAIPKARTAAEKLQMKGEPVDINNIERVVKDSFPKAGDNINRAGNLITDLLKNIFGLVGRFIGFIFVSIGIFCLILLFMILFNHEDIGHLTTLSKLALNSSIYWYAKLGISLILVSFCVMILISGLKLLFNINFKSRILYLIFGVLFLVGCVFQGIAVSKTVYRFHADASKSERRTFDSCPDTLYLHAFPGDTSLVTKKWSMDTDKGSCNIAFHEDKAVVSVSFQELNIVASKDGKMHIDVYKSARGASKVEAVKHANDLIYLFEVKDNQIWLSNSLTIDESNPFYFQNANIKLKLPAGTIIIADEQISEMIDNSEAYDDESNCSIYKVTRDGLECLSSSENEDDSEGDNEDEIHVKIETTEDGVKDSSEVIIKKEDKEIKIIKRKKGSRE